MSGIQGYADALSSQLGVRVSVIENVDFDQLMQSGVTVKLHITRWRAEKKRVLSDIGYTPGSEDVRQAWTTHLDFNDLGALKLLPIAFVKALASCENAARQQLRAYGIATRWGCFVPVAKNRFLEWYNQDLPRERRYTELRDDILADYDGIKERARTAFQNAAIDAYYIENNLPRNQDIKVPWSYRDNYAERLMAEFWTRDALRDSFAWKREFGFLPIPSLMAREQAERERILAEARMTQEQKQLLESLNADFAKDAYAAKKAIVTDFLTDVKTEIQTQIIEATNTVMDAIKKNARAPGGSIAQVRRLVENIEQLNYFDDPLVIDQMQELRARVGYGGGEKIDQDALTGALRRVNTLAKQELEAITGDMKMPRRLEEPAQLELLDLPAVRPLKPLQAEVEIAEPLPVVRSRRL